MTGRAGKGEPGRILLVKMSAMGDVVMTLPTLWALRRRFPGAAIDWLVEAPSAGLLEGHPAIDRLLVSPRHLCRGLAESGQALAAWRRFRDFRRELRAVRYDVVLDLQGLFKSGAWVGLARGDRKVGFDRTREKAYWFLNEKMPAYDPERHAARRYLDAAAYLGAEVSETAPEKYYTPSPAGEAEADASLAGFPGPRVVLNPGARWATKRWPLEHWEGLAARLARETDLAIVLTGGSSDIPLGRAIARVAPERILDLCGRTSLPGLAVVLGRATAVVTADTGPMHLAAAVGAGGLALFGPTKPGRTGPFGGRFEIVTPAKDCLGCLKKKCATPCLETLTVDTVWERLADWLKRGP